MFLQKITKWSLLLAAFLVPIFFLPWTINPLETNKQALLTILVVAACLAEAGQLFYKKEISFRKNAVNLILPIFLILLAISSALSNSFLLSWFGTSSQEYTSFFSLLIFAIYFWLVGYSAREQKFSSQIILSLISGSIIAGIIGLLALFQIFLPFSFSQTQAFNTVGTINALGVFLAISTVLANSLFLLEKKSKKIITFLTLGLSSITFVFLFLVNYWLVWLVLLAGLIAILTLVFVKAGNILDSKKYLLPMFLAAGTVLFLLLPSWQFLSIPIEVTPNFNTSIIIAKQTLMETNLWFGSGPGTYLFDYAKFRPLEINQSNFWDMRFDRGFSEILTMLPTKGLLPSLTIIIFSLTLGFFAIKTLLKKQEKQWLAFIVFPAWLALIVAFFFYSANFTLVFVFFLLSGLIYSLTENKKNNFSLIKSIRTKYFVASGFTVLAIISVTVFFLVIENLSAEMAFAKAIKTDRAGGDLKEVAKLIDRAASLNRYNDSFYRNLAETLLLEIQVETGKIGNNQPTEEQSQYLQALIAASINSGKRATELEPRNVVNWLELASLYRAFSSALSDTSEFAINACQTAINLEPLNPANYLDLGKTYLALALNLGPLTTSNDPATKQQAEQKRAEYFSAAETSFNTAIQLKADYAPAHYQLSVTYEQEGRLDDAIGKMESINKYNPQDVGVTFELGVLYLQRLDDGDLARAENAFKQAIILMPSYSNAHWYLSYVYEQTGNIPAAIYEIEAVVKLNPDNETVKARLERLKAGQTSTETTPLE